MNAVSAWRGPDWSGRWRNELSFDQRCWTPGKVLQRRRAISLGRRVRSALPCPCPPLPCPTLVIGSWKSIMELPQKAAALRRTLEDLPMQHTQEDALTMLGRKRAETAAQNRVLRQEGDDFKMVSNFGRRMFDCAVNNRGKCPLPPPSPSEAAALFFSAPRPSWSTQARDSNRLKPRAQSMTAEQTPEIGSPTSSRQRPDSEPPIKWREDRELNHLRHHRQMYPHINRLVQRYNEDMKVVCSQVPDECEKRRNSKDYSVASGFFLVPLRQAEEAETKSELGTVDSEVSKQGEGNIKENVSAHSKESNLLLQQENKMEDQLTREPELPVPSPKSLDVKEETAGDKEAIVDEEPSPPWRCWVDDATVSTIHSRASSLVTTEEVALEEDPTMQKGHIAHTSAKHADAHSPGALTPGTPQSPAGALVKEHISPQLAQPAQKEKKGRKKVEETLPEPPAPPLVEPEIILEEVVEEEAVPEPEPEPVPPSYICPSSEGKSHAVEIRRWIYKSPFKAANKTMPIF